MPARERSLPDPEGTRCHQYDVAYPFGRGRGDDFQERPPSVECSISGAFEDVYPEAQPSSAVASVGP
jgi:hypothetical protein